jgi:hypothetical protein
VSRPSEISGELIDELRARRRAGEYGYQLTGYLHSLGLASHEVANYMREAFCLSRVGFSAEPAGRNYEHAIDDAAGQWRDARPYPDLMRRRDRFAFKQAAAINGAVIVVRAAERAAARYIGLAGYRAQPAHLPAESALTPDWRGLIAADPSSEPLLLTLACLNRPMDYQAYRNALATLGFFVMGPERGYVVRDKFGDYFYAGYSIYGIFDAATGRERWRGREGERFRGDLITRMGAALVAIGPPDLWQLRSELLLAFQEPSPPALFFLPDGGVSVAKDVEEMRSECRARNISWESLAGDSGRPATA